MRFCRIHDCGYVKQWKCCTDCDRSCRNRCMNHPDRCGCSTWEKPLDKKRMTVGADADGPQQWWRLAGCRIIELRRKAGLTQGQLAERIEASQSAVCSWENGLRCPKGKFRSRLAEALGVTDEELYDRG